jgi:hypothetical protein
MARDFTRKSSKDLSKQAFDAIPDHRIADLSRYRQAKAMVFDLILTAEQYKPFGLDFPAFPVEHPVVRRFYNPDFMREFLGGRINHSPSTFYALLRAAASAPAGRPWSPSALGNRALFFVCCCWVGTSFYLSLC